MKWWYNHNLLPPACGFYSLDQETSSADGTTYEDIQVSGGDSPDPGFLDSGSGLVISKKICCNWEQHVLNNRGFGGMLWAGNWTYIMIIATCGVNKN